jgi:hypothetical protein
MDLQKEREKQNLVENKQNDLLVKFLKQNRDRFDYADTSQWIAQEQNETDLLLVCDSITNWCEKAKNETQKKELYLLLQSLWRTSSYCVNLETTCKSSVSKYITTEKRNDELVKEKRIIEIELIQTKEKLNAEIEKLKKEIEFINNSK